MVGEHIPFYITSEFCEESQTNELAQQTSDFKSRERALKDLKWNTFNGAKDRDLMLKCLRQIGLPGI